MTGGQNNSFGQLRILGILVLKLTVKSRAYSCRLLVDAVRSLELVYNMPKIDRTFDGHVYSVEAT